MSSERVEDQRRGGPLPAARGVAFPASPAARARVRLASVVASLVLAAPFATSIPAFCGDPREKVQPDSAVAGPDDASGSLTPAEREALMRRIQEKRERDAAGAKPGPPAREPAEEPPTPPPTTVR